MVLKTKGGYVRCDFEKGAVSGLGSRAASFTTDKKEVQEAIEACEKYKNGTIKLVDTYEQTKEKEETRLFVESVTTLQEARKYLLEQEDAEMDKLQNKAAVLEYAEKKGIVFPNYK